MPPKSPQARLHLAMPTLKNNASSTAPKHFALKETQPNTHVKWTDLGTNQRKRPDALISE